jgi:myo-inositol-1(or 4)-monophosphatase
VPILSSDDLDVALEAARVGAATVAAAFGSPVDAQWKSDANPVTQIDRDAEAAIIDVISDMRPDDKVLGEETGGADWTDGRVWIIDPLDGTVNFIHGIPHLAVSVALWSDGVGAVGVICDVTRREEFTAVRGKGAWLNQHEIAVSKQDLLATSLVATGFPYDRNLHGRRYASVMGEVLTRAQGIRRFGSAALDLAWVACGRYDAYWETGIAAWDAAAGTLLIQEAGGRITNLRGGPHRLDDPVIVVSNGLVHNDLISAITSS